MGFIRNFAVTLFSQGLVFVAGFLNGVIIARALGRTGRGEYGLVVFLATVLLVLFGEGVHRANVYLTSRDKSDDNISKLFSNSVAYWAIIFLVFSGLLFLPGRLYQFVFPGLNPLYVRIGIGVALFFIFNRSIQGIFLGLQQFWHYNLSYIGPTLVFFVLNAIFFFTISQMTTRLVLTNYFAAMSVVFVISLIIFRREHRIHFRPNIGQFFRDLSIRSRATLAYLMIYLLIQSNLYIVNYKVGLAQAGLFAVAMNIANLIQRVPNVAGTVLFPKVSESRGSYQMNLTLRVTGVAFLIGISLAVFFYFFGEQLIVYFYKETFRPSYHALMWLFPGILMMSVASILNINLWGRGFPRVSIIAPFLGVVVDVTFCLIFIPKRGIIGAAQAASLGFGTFAVIIIGYFLWTYRKKWKSIELGL
ncbi:MAG: oligosaccharide flippase family protein [Calditrichaeota bacterium]|nr:oligosaccharide flippase family protein [Calditrichota bacterium]